MLAIRMQRTGRSGHAQFRVIVQDSRFSPTRGRVVSYLGSYNPHTKAATIDSQKASQYLQNGAQPSDMVARLFKKEGIKLPAWVKLDQPKNREVRNPDKRRSTAPATPEAPAEPVAEVSADEIATEAPAEEPIAEVPVEEPAAETPSEEAPPAEQPAQAEESQPAEPSPAEEPADTEEKTEKTAENS